MAHVDLNCDMGESFGAYTIGNDAAVLPFVTSANIACGFHGGDPSVMRATVQAAVAHSVSIGAHPGLPDLVGFGRRTMAVTPRETYDMVVVQIGALAAVAKSAGTRLRHVKPHGALYNMAAQQTALADAIARAVRDVDAALMLFGLSGSALIDAGKAHGLHTVSEVFADRHYLADGSLVPRTQAGALVADAATAAERAVTMVTQQHVVANDGTRVSLVADSICIHGDASHAADFARTIRTALTAAGVTLAAPVSS
jgi:5-oxoprolinase (ATP-hydrolysing) subunit A